MCVPACTRKIATDFGRRNLLKGVVGATASAAALAVSGCQLTVEPRHLLRDRERMGQGQGTIPHAMMSGKVSFSGIVDLTHTLDVNFPTFGGEPQLELETLYTLADGGYNMFRWLVVEHTGTHMDAPFHFSDQDSADEIPIEQLVGPLAVIDIRAKAEADPDAQLTPDDITAWEAEHGPLPAGAIVALHSGWDAYVTSDKFRNADDDGVLHFPGFHIETAELLITERDIKGVMVDTLSLDYGPSADFAFHYRWLASNRWGMEGVANLGQLPPTGAIVFAGGPKIAGATGGPSRVIAFV
ncbi:MAG: cyclase family protein [Caldilineaceae bacterium]|nr:cyclase family protein [Caldilineaceae bacterium]